MAKHKYPVIKDIGLVVHDTFEISFEYFDQEWKFEVRSLSEANIAKGCLTYYKPMWDGEKTDVIGIHDTIIDIGAHVGFFCNPISFLAGRVIAFEPAPANYELLERNIALNESTVSPFRMAVGAEVGAVKLNLGVQGTTGHSITNRKRGGVSTIVECTNLEQIVASYDPTILKINCEGGEWEILTDPDLLKGVRMIVAELHKVKQHDPVALGKVLLQAGMRVDMKHNSWFSKLVAWR